jgi:oligopeptide/dipeptide ABC transporter ATP-binding protein
MTTPLLVVEDLHVEISTPRGAVHAVTGASFTLDRGGALGVVGESGCGKSMTLRAILGILPHSGRITRGRIVYDGMDLTSMPARRLRALLSREIAMVFQEPTTALNPIMRVGDQIAEAPRRRLGYSARHARERALDVMRLVGIPDPTRRMRAYPHELSGGLRQRVMIAIALSAEPTVILCDEPTTALDVTIQDQILKLLLSLQDSQGLSVVFVTHDLAVVAQTCRSVAVMYAGRVIEFGEVSSVFREPRHPYTLGLLRSVPTFGGSRSRLQTIPGSPPDLADPLPGCPYNPRCPFVQADCLDGDFPLLPIAADRTTACIHPDLAAQSVRERPVLADA